MATVLGYRQPSVKGKAILVDPVPNVATPELREALQDALLAQKQQVILAPRSLSRLVQQQTASAVREPHSTELEPG